MARAGVENGPVQRILPPRQQANGTIERAIKLAMGTFVAGPHTLEVRAFDGTDQSETATRGFVVEGPEAKAGGRSTMILALISGLMLAAVGAVAILCSRRKRG